MKKMIQNLFAAVLLGLMSTGANAIDLGGTTTITILDCSQLANDVDIVLSSNVVGSLDCTTDSTYIGLATCHTSGLRTERSASEAPIDNQNTCSSSDLTYNTTSAKCEGVVSGVRFPAATTAQGTVVSQYPGSDDCTAATADTEAKAALANQVP